MCSSAWPPYFSLPPEDDLMFKSPSLAILLCVLLTHQYAAAQITPEDKRAVEHPVKKVERMHRAGLTVSREFPGPLDARSLKACVAKYGHLRDEAKPLRAEALALKRMYYRLDLMRASDAAFVCVHCRESGRDCSKIPPLLKATRDRLAAEFRPRPRSDPPIVWPKL